jgi:HTH-type transcriptional regulator / antitoxin HigA
MNIGVKYWKLIKRFPLRAIRTEKEADLAQEVAIELGMRGDRLSRDENDYYDLLIRLIMDYEAALPEVQATLAKARSAPPQRVLRSIMEDNGITQAQLAREINCQEANLSAFLKGRRGLSKITAMKLAKRFCLSVDFFMPRLDERLAG